MADILRTRNNSVLKSYNRSNELSSVQLKGDPEIKYGTHEVCVKKEETDEACLRSPLTSLNRTLSCNHIWLDRWIIKPLGDGICVEGHRRLPNFHAVYVCIVQRLGHIKNKRRNTRIHAYTV